jgi:hypothetical protein
MLLRPNIRGGFMRSKSATKEMVEIPKDEYRILKEIYKTVKRQRLLFRIEEAEKNFRKGKVEKTSVDDFIINI